MPNREVNLYFENVVLSSVRDRFLFVVQSQKGKHLQDRWTWIPSSEDVGNHELTLEVRNLDDEIMANAKTTICVFPADAGAGRSITHLAIGDSFTDPSIYTDELLRLFTAAGNPGYRLLGTHHVEGSVPGNVHEGYGGWKYINFVEKAEDDPGSDARNYKKSPFVFKTPKGPRFDFARYIRENLDGQIPDFITILLGPNDVALAVDADREEFVERAIAASHRLINGLREGAPHSTIGIVSPMPTSMDQDIFGEAYGCVLSSWSLRKNLYRLRERLFAEYSQCAKKNVLFVPAYVNFDTRNNFPQITAPVHAQSRKSVSRGSNAHPIEDGYRQIGDSIYAWLKGQLSSAH